MLNEKEDVKEVNKEWFDLKNKVCNLYFILIILKNTNNHIKYHQLMSFYLFIYKNLSYFIKFS